MPIGPFDAQRQGLGGWTLDVQHTYDPHTQTLYLGNGSRRSAESIDAVLTTFAGFCTSAFNGGDYYGNPEPLRGLQIARMVGHMTYLSAEALQAKFGRRRRGNTRQFEIDSYFEYQGQKFARQYDANSYIRVQAAMDEMDLLEQFGSLETAFAKWRGETLLVSFNTDWLFPVPEVARVEEAMAANGTDVRHERLVSPNGHDTFLIDYDLITPYVRDFLAGLQAR